MWDFYWRSFGWTENVFPWCLNKNVHFSTQDDLEFKEGELQKAENTSQSLLGESSKLQEDLGKVEELHDKITNEKDFLTEKIEEMTKEIENYRWLLPVHVLLLSTVNVCTQVTLK